MKEEEFLKCQEAGQICDRKTIETIMKTVMGLSVKTILEPVDNYNYRFAVNAAKDEGEVKGIKANDMIFCTALESALKMPDNVLDEHFTLGDLSSVLDTGSVDRIRTPYVDEWTGEIPKLLENVCLTLLGLVAYHKGFVQKKEFENRNIPVQQGAQNMIPSRRDSDKAQRQREQHEFYERLMSQMSFSANPWVTLDLFFRIRIKDYCKFLNTLPYIKCIVGGVDVYRQINENAENYLRLGGVELTVGKMFDSALENAAESCDIVRYMLLIPLFALKYRNRYNFFE